jgi:translation initiation factor IF-3
MGKEKTIELKINRQIRSENVRLVGDNVESGIYPIGKALAIADELDSDLIEIGPINDPPVCKIMDYSKYIYDQKKKQKDLEKKNKANRIDLKEMRFTPNTDEHDFEFKKRHIIGFITDGDRVKTCVFFKGREIAYKEKGEILLLKLADELSDIATVDRLPILEGHRMTMTLKPKK